MTRGLSSAVHLVRPMLLDSTAAKTCGLCWRLTEALPILHYSVFHGHEEWEGCELPQELRCECHSMQAVPSSWCYLSLRLHLKLCFDAVSLVSPGVLILQGKPVLDT